MPVAAFITEPPFPIGATLPSSPACPARALTAKGAYIPGEDGGLLLDVCCGFGDILLGHADVSVDAAVQAQWSGRGRTVEALEHELAERVAELILCAQAVRFTNDASTALVAAVGTARKVMGRGMVLVCRPGEARDGLGVAAPERLASAAAAGPAMNLRFGDAGALQQAVSANPPAAIVLALTDRTAADPSFVRTARRLADSCGALLILDQVQTGLRLGPGGGEAMLGAAADMTVLGASLANGYPIAALAGQRGLIQAATGLAPAAGVSLAAGCATLDKLNRDGVCNLLRIRGAELEAELESLLRQTGAGTFVKVCGDPTYSFLDISPYKGCGSAELQASFQSESLARGVFTLGAHVMSYAHGDNEICGLLDAYAAVFTAMTARIERERGADTAVFEPLVRPAMARQGLAA